MCLRYLKPDKTFWTCTLVRVHYQHSTKIHGESRERSGFSFVIKSLPPLSGAACSHVLTGSFLSAPPFPEGSASVNLCSPCAENSLPSDLASFPWPPASGFYLDTMLKSSFTLSHSWRSRRLDLYMAMMEGARNKIPSIPRREWLLIPHVLSRFLSVFLISPYFNFPFPDSPDHLPPFLFILVSYVGITPHWLKRLRCLRSCISRCPHRVMGDKGAS